MTGPIFKKDGYAVLPSEDKTEWIVVYRAPDSDIDELIADGFAKRHEAVDYLLHP